MAITTPFVQAVTNLPPSILITATPILFVLAVLTFVRLYTTSRYRYSLSKSASTSSKSTNGYPPPVIPYTIPVLGHALAFLAPRPGQFWASLFQSHPRSVGACTLLLGGNKTHILFSSSAVQALFKKRDLSRDGFNQQVVELGFGLDNTDCHKYYGYDEGPDDTGLTPVQQQERVHHNYMLEKKSVNELTAKFSQVLKDELAGEFKGETGGDDDDGIIAENLYAWLQERLFTASTTAFLGSRILEMYPNLREDFFEFDRYLLTMFFRVPKLFSPTAYNVRERTLAGLMNWQEQMLKECNQKPTDPDGDIDWEPVYGSRANRARQRYYSARGLSLRARAGMDLGFLFGLSSNAIPAAGWMIMQILNPQGDKTLPGRIMDELERAQNADGSLDIPTLTALPLLQSTYSEVLRLYVDLLVTRELKEDLTLPLDEGGHRQVFLDKHSVVMAPSWLGHRDERLWTDPPAEQFYAERFLKKDPETGKETFSTNGTNGKFFPFGGGKTICPGRVFAKQEVLASVAMVMLSFEVECTGFVDGQGKATEVFPGLRQSYSGSGIMAAQGDMRVKIRARKGASKGEVK